MYENVGQKHLFVPNADRLPRCLSRSHSICENENDSKQGYLNYQENISYFLF